MKIRQGCIPTARVIATLSRRYYVNPVWLWDVVEEEFNLIKGLGTVMTQDEIDVLEDICKHAFD